MATPTKLAELSHERLAAADAHADVEQHRFVLAVPAALTVLEGHFPGSPILPAFAELAEVVTRIHRAWPDLGPWQGAPTVKFQAPIRPGFVLELRLHRAQGAGQVRFTITAAGTPCASGTLTFACDPMSASASPT
jgi:3-hydroxymyristoyl/3-hydroxydecanoyl-(acyl carrier protein) dehydratase